MAQETTKKVAETVSEGAAPGQFRTSKSAAELVVANVEGYAEPGLAEHKSQKHLETYWQRGSGGLRPEGHDVEDEEQRLRELEEKRAPGLVARAMGAVGGALSSAAGAVMPGRFKTSKSAAELAYSEAEGYAEEGTAEHKGPKHLENYWFAGKDGLRPEDPEEEAERLHELEARKQAAAAQGGGMVEQAKQAVATATEKAGEYVQSAKGMLGMDTEKK